MNLKVHLTDAWKHCLPHETKTFIKRGFPVVCLLMAVLLKTNQVAEIMNDPNKTTGWSHLFPHFQPSWTRKVDSSLTSVVRSQVETGGGRVFSQLVWGFKL